jgi:O2-independent ubiquinone biosynthesis protein UbiV
MTRISITLGPLLFNWSPERWSDFYARIADEAPVDRVCIGEVVCSKRLPLYVDRLPQAVERLQQAGKEVVLSSLALVTLKRERKSCAELGADGDFDVEINDLSMLSHLEEGRVFTAGPLINVYNGGTMEFLARRGARSVCLPPELALPAVERLAQEGRRLGVATEVWAFGRLPLAISGRCYHARVHGHAKDSCQFVCDRDEDGLLVETLDGQDFLVTWWFSTYTSPAGSFAARVSSEGILLDGPPESQGVQIRAPDCFACKVVHPNPVSNGRSVLVPWINNAELGGTHKNVLANLIVPEPRIDNLVSGSPGPDDVKMTFSSRLNVRYSMQWSTNLTTWQAS